MIDFSMISALAVFIAALIFFIVRSSRRGIDMLARPTINRYAFYFGKLNAFIACAFIPVAALHPQIRSWQTPQYLVWLAIIILNIGISFALSAMRQLGNDLVAGIPETGIHRLQTGGIYRFSRNPLYLGVFLLIIASLLYVPHPVNILAGLTAIGIHHFIVTREEKFLIGQYGETYVNYMKRVRRYL